MDIGESLCARASLDDVRIHDLRHYFASKALALDEGLLIISKLLSHSRVETTACYAHLASESMQQSATHIADNITAEILARVGNHMRRNGETMSSTEMAVLGDHHLCADLLLL